MAPHEAATTVRLVTDRCPDQLKLPFALWTRAAVQQLLVERFDVQVSVRTVGRYLARWGLTPQKPLRRAYERDPVAVKHWLEEQYPAIERQAKAEKAEIHWGDQLGLRSDHQTGTSYGRRGQTPVIPGTGQRFRCNMMSTITNRGHLSFMVFKERFTAAVCIRFLRRLTRQAGRKVILIVDRHPVHRSRAVQRWLATNAGKIALFFLPGYSPDLSPTSSSTRTSRATRWADGDPPRSPKCSRAFAPTCAAHNANPRSSKATSMPNLFDTPLHRQSNI